MYGSKRRTKLNIKATPLSQEAYEKYGDVISIRSDVKPVSANLGFAKRYNFLSELKNLRPNHAEANLCFFHCDPMVSAPACTFEMKLLENHPKSTQVFIPMGVERYLVLVCLGGEKPDLSTLRAFLVNGSQGISYRPGVWHHPLVAMDRVSDFACLVFEDGSESDCSVVKLESSVQIDF